MIDAFNARGAAGLEALYDPEIVYVYDVYKVVGHTRHNIRRSDRDRLLDQFQNRTWPNWGPKVTSYDVLEVDGKIVTTSEDVIFFGGSNRHLVTYEISEDGLVLREEHVAQE